jgi:hypothetical protein
MSSLTMRGVVAKPLLRGIRPFLQGLIANNE